MRAHGYQWSCDARRQEFVVTWYLQPVRGITHEVWYTRCMSGTYSLVVGDRGRVVLPADLRERAGLAPGTALTLLETPDGLVLLTRDQLLERVRQDLKGLDLVGALLAERRAEADRDDVTAGPA